jgi:hypothetical protein
MIFAALLQLRVCPRTSARRIRNEQHIECSDSSHPRLAWLGGCETDGGRALVSNFRLETGRSSPRLCWVSVGIGGLQWPQCFA